MECRFRVFSKFTYVILVAVVFHSPFLSEQARRQEEVLQKILQKQSLAAQEQFRPQGV